MEFMRRQGGTGWVAIFSGNDFLVARTRVVDSWDLASGTALVVDEQLGARRPVTDYADFSHLETADSIIAALPGGGWRGCMRGRGPHDDDSPREDVVAWLVLSNGEVTPVTVDADGYIGAEVDFDRFFPPN
ncbi:hypothetical protein [Nocardia sp. NPDC057030]|uniref:hypothetical protein n=1 Tax=unclassified Nocardia TaxID=2637762 RepID=UPI00362C9312